LEKLLISSSTPPSNPRVGQLWFDSNTNQLKRLNGSQWVGISVEQAINAQNALNADTVDGFHASQTPAPNTIPVANNLGLIPSAWLTNSIREFENPIDLTNATEDYFLQVGEVAKISFSNKTSVPLKIATEDDTYYELHVIPSNPGGTSGGTPSPIILYPNNTSYENKFVYAEVFRNLWNLGSSYLTYSGFRIGVAFSSITCFIINRTIYKETRSFTNVYGTPQDYPSLNISACNWRDTTTPWTSLGTIVFPQSSSGEILIRRLM